MHVVLTPKSSVLGIHEAPGEYLLNERSLGFSYHLKEDSELGFP